MVEIKSSVRRMMVLMLAASVSAMGGAEVRGEAAQGAGVTANVDLPRYPAVSPDGKSVTFSWRGDLWLVPTTGGLATRLTVNPFDELYSAFSPDGKKIAFTSSRNSAGNVFTMNVDGTDIKQVTHVDRSLLLTQWSKDADGTEKLRLGGLLEPMPFSVPQQYEVSPEGGDISKIHSAVGTYPIVSPDGKRVLFVRGATPWSRRGYRGPDNRDVWMLDRTTSKYTRLTAFDGNDGRAKWLDNDTVVFVSDRLNNTYNLFSLNLGAADEKAVALTKFNGDGVDDYDIAHASKSIVFSRWDKLYTLDAAVPGAVEQAIAIRAGEEEADLVRFQDTSRSVSEAALSPDGKTMAVVSFGEVYVRGLDTRAPTRRVTVNLPGRKQNLVWSADGERLLFVSDASGREEIYAAKVKTTRTELRKRMTDPATRPTGEAATTQATDATSQPADPATQPAEPSAPSAKDRSESESEQVGPRRGLPPGVTPPSGAGGGASSAAAGGEVSKWADALSFDVKKLWDSPTNDVSLEPSPDGKSIAFLRSSWELVIHDEATGKDRVLVSNFDSIGFRWSPDSRYIAYATEDRNNNSDVFIVPADGSEKPVNISRHPNFDSSPRWSADGKILAFLSNRTGTGEETAAYTVFLDKETEQLAGPELEAYFKDAAAAARRRTPPATRPSTTQPSTQPATQGATRRGGGATTRPMLKRADLEDAFLRLRRGSSVRGSVSDLEISPAGDRLYFVGSLGTTRGLLTQGRESPEPTRIAAAGDVTGVSLVGDSLTMVESGRAAVVKLPGGETEYYDPSDRLKVDLQALSKQKFLEAARIMQLFFYNAQMNGVDWKANTEHYLPLAMSARTADEFEFVANRFIGELNASHLGIDAPGSSSPLTQSVGRLGAEVSRVEGGFKVLSVMTDGPSDRGAMKLKTGDIIRAIDFEPIGPKDTLEMILTGKLGTEVVVSVKREGKDLELLITPTSAESLSNLAYNQWRLKKLAEVEKLSGGKLGYIHIQGMNQASLETYKRDLFAAVDGKEGMIIDVRWNGGGSTADLLLASIMSPYHAFTQMRDGPKLPDSYPVDRLYIPRFIGPINMLCNERSFSNAEIISHAFKTLKRGTLVGNQTAGGVISTGGATLLDGTTVRTPGRGWFTPDATNMELNGAQPDIVIVQTPDDEVSGEDRQLVAAVEDLMKRLKK